MKHCHRCDIDMPDAALFCIRCGNSFGARYCPRLHPNPISADYCRACGSPDLSTPQRPNRWSHVWIVLMLALAFLALICTPIMLAQAVDVSPRQVLGVLILTATAAGALISLSSIRR
jgi:ribosomal protein L40E